MHGWPRDLEPGAYAYSPVAINDGEAPELIDAKKIRFVIPEKIYNERGIFEVGVDNDGHLSVRCVEGLLLVEPVGSNFVRIRLGGHN